MASEHSLRAAYGAGPWHLLVLVVSFGVATSAVTTLGPTALWDSAVWWQTMVVWFVGAALVHDLLLFPVYALVDRAATAGAHLHHRRGGGSPRRVPLLNHVRIPALGSGLLLLVFFPGIIEQGAGSHLTATGLTQDPFLERWLWLSATGFVLSGAGYALRVVRARRRAGSDR